MRVQGPGPTALSRAVCTLQLNHSGGEMLGEGGCHWFGFSGARGTVCPARPADPSGALQTRAGREGGLPPPPPLPQAAFLGCKGPWGLLLRLPRKRGPRKANGAWGPGGEQRRGLWAGAGARGSLAGGHAEVRVAGRPAGIRGGAFLPQAQGRALPQTRRCNSRIFSKFFVRPLARTGLDKHRERRVAESWT